MSYSEPEEGETGEELVRSAEDAPEDPPGRHHVAARIVGVADMRRAGTTSVASVATQAIPRPAHPELLEDVAPEPSRHVERQTKVVKARSPKATAKVGST
jgi:hypothetical protein